MSKDAYEDYLELRQLEANGCRAPVMGFFTAYRRQPKGAARRQFRLHKKHDMRFCG